MGIGRIFPSVHKHQGWIGQYHRMLRWYEKFKVTNPGDFENPNIDEQHDILFTCFQNIMILKDWLHYSGSIPKSELNDYFNQNLELRVCRDICNGTKHFVLTNASVDDDFTIIREYDPFHDDLDMEKNKTIVLSGGYKFELKELAWKCIELWKVFIQNSELNTFLQV